MFLFTLENSEHSDLRTIPMIKKIYIRWIIFIFIYFVLFGLYNELRY